MFAIIPIIILNYEVKYKTNLSTYIDAELFRCLSDFSCLSIRCSRDQLSPLVHQIAIRSQIFSQVSETMFILLLCHFDCELALFIEIIEIGTGPLLLDLPTQSIPTKSHSL